MQIIEKLSDINPCGEPEDLPRPKFEKMRWWNVKQYDEILGRRDLTLNGRPYHIKEVGIQESIPETNGVARWHYEDADEWIMPFKGRGVLFVGNERKDCSRINLDGVLTQSELGLATFSLVKKRLESGIQVMAMQINVGAKEIVVPGILTPRNSWHGTFTYRTGSLTYGVVKGVRG